KIVLSVRIGVPGDRRGHAGLRVVNANEIHARVRMFGASVERWKSKGIGRCSRGAVGQVVGRCKQTVVDGAAQPIRRLGLINANRITLNYCIKDSVTCADTGFSRLSEKLAKEPAALVR